MEDQKKLHNFCKKKIIILLFVDPNHNWNREVGRRVEAIEEVVGSIVGTKKKKNST